MTHAVAEVEAAGLVGWTVEVDDPGELLTWLPAGRAFGFLRGGDGIVGWGEAVRLTTRDPGEVSAALSAVTVRDDVGLPGCGPVAIVSLGFDPATDASVVVVPKVVLGRREGRSWLTLVNPPGAVEVPALRRRPVAAASAPPATLTAAVPAESEWADSVRRAVAAIKAGELDKVVLARALDVTAPAALDPRAVAARLAARFPSCFTFVCDGLVGASPELLVRRIGRHAESLVLAGTVRRGGGAAEDAELERTLMASRKDAAEHRYAAESVREVFGSVAADMVSDGSPQLLRLANVTHLATHVEAWLGADAPTALDLAARLHPTAAVGGTPRSEALAMISDLEAAPRGRYAGPVGWMDAKGDGEFAIALRCAQLSGDTARLWAGAGIVADSNPDAEVAETTAKFDAVLSALL
ncbi:MAG TPA: isochorismate synthase [Mycobacteriales bacterium]|nr:isochorismate synthase [Mycobacteriales bacterium]